jgi:hypothetical protein
MIIIAVEELARLAFEYERSVVALVKADFAAAAATFL